MEVAVTLPQIQVIDTSSIIGPFRELKSGFLLGSGLLPLATNSLGVGCVLKQMPWPKVNGSCGRRVLLSSLRLPPQDCGNMRSGEQYYFGFCI